MIIFPLIPKNFSILKWLTYTNPLTPDHTHKREQKFEKFVFVQVQVHLGTVKENKFRRQQHILYQEKSELANSHNYTCICRLDIIQVHTTPRHKIELARSRSVYRNPRTKNNLENAKRDIRINSDKQNRITRDKRRR